MNKSANIYYRNNYCDAVQALEQMPRSVYLLNQKLIRLEQKYPVPFALEEMAYTYDGQTSTQVLTAVGVK